MRLPLLRKELREQRPFLGFSLFFAALEVLDALQRGVDVLPLGSFFDASCDGAVVLVMVLGFAMGTGLLVREQDEGTLAFLEGLPVTRGRLFGAKLLVGWAVLLVYPTLKALLSFGLHLWGRGALDHAVQAQVLAASWTLSALLSLAGLAVGLWLGFFRSLAWFALGALLAGVALAQRQLPALAAINPAEACELRLVGTRADLDAAVVAGPLGVAAFALGLAWLLFAGRWTGVQRALRGVAGRPVWSAVVAVATVAAAFGAAVLLTRSEGGSGAKTPPAGKPQFRSGPPGLKQTRHYRLHYPAPSAAEALALAERADATFEEVHQALGIAPGESVDVDLSGSMRNTAGTAYHERIQLELDGDPLATLAHETVHVAARRLGGGGETDNHQRMLVFHEGLAHWVGRRYLARSSTEIDRLVAAALFARGEVEQDELLDESLLARNRDERLKYPLGAALIEALVARHGPFAPRRVLEAAASPRLETGLSPVALNQAVFQLAGIDLALVLDDLFRKLGRDAAELALEIARLPRPRAAALYRSDDGWYGVQPELSGPVPEGWTVTARFRPLPDSPLREHRTVTPDDGQPAWRHQRHLARGQICFQLGLQSSARAALFEPWECLPLRGATAWPRKTD